MKKSSQSKSRIYPLAIVAAVVALIEVAMTVLYPSLHSNLERFLLLIVIIALPLSIVAAFIFLWIKRPGFLYPPSEFTGNPEHMRLLTCAYCQMHISNQYYKSDDGDVLCHHCMRMMEAKQKTENPS